MYKLFRRLSSSFFPRPDRPWNEDATSNAPQIGLKRRLSVVDEDDIPSTPSSVKKLRREDTEIDLEADDVAQSMIASSQAGKETEDVKEVTKGVEEVELEDTEDAQKDNIDAVNAAAAIPLPSSPILEAQPDVADNKPVADEAASAKLVDTAEVVQNPETTQKGDVEVPEKKIEEEVAKDVEAEAAVDATETPPVEFEVVADTSEEPTPDVSREAKDEPPSQVPEAVDAIASA